MLYMGGLNITIYGYVKHFFVMKSVVRYDYYDVQGGFAK